MTAISNKNIVLECLLLNKWLSNKNLDYKTDLNHFKGRQFVVKKDKGDVLVAINCVYGYLMPHKLSRDPCVTSSDGTINMCKNGPDVIFPRSYLFKFQTKTIPTDKFIDT